MKLYYSPGACSRAPHIIAHEIGLALDLIKVDLHSKKTSDGGDYTQVTAKGYVPALVLDDGRIITEGGAVLQYLGDLKSEKGLVPADAYGRAKVAEWLSYTSTELHKNFGPLFNPALPEADKDAAKGRITLRLGEVEKQLGTSAFITGSTFTIADALLFVVLSWSGYLGFDLSSFPNTQAFLERVGSRDSVKKAIAAEEAL